MKDYKYTHDTQKTAKILIRKAKARQGRNDRLLFFNAAILGIYGWHITIPVILGIIGGKLLDKYVPLPPMSWTFNCVLIGFFMGVYNANRWVQNEGYKKNIRSRNKTIKKMEGDN